MNRSKRQFLKRGLATATLFLPVPYAWVWAQSEGTMKLLKLPKIALVMGNSNYKGAPLANPANDARAMAAALKATGFDVTLRMDAGRSDMASAVQTYSTALASTKGVGLFYYAGHGVQLAWRNYMMPVDADINTIADIQNQGVEVNVLLAGITKAATWQPGSILRIFIGDGTAENPNAGILLGNGYSYTAYAGAWAQAPPTTLQAPHRTGDWPRPACPDPAAATPGCSCW